MIEDRYARCSAGVRVSISSSNTEAVLAITASGLRSSWVTRARKSSLVQASSDGQFLGAAAFQLLPDLPDDVAERRNQGVFAIFDPVAVDA